MSQPAVARTVRFVVNGDAVAAEVEPRVTLLDFLRDRLGLTGAKKGCNEGACGTCTVLVDGQRMNGCLILVVQCEGRQVTTIEGIAPGDDELHPVQAAFIRHDAFQCGYCTPGQILSAVACIAEGHAGSEAEVREWMSGNSAAVPPTRRSPPPCSTRRAGWPAETAHEELRLRRRRPDRGCVRQRRHDDHADRGRHRASQLVPARHRRTGPDRRPGDGSRGSMGSSAAATGSRSARSPR